MPEGRCGTLATMVDAPGAGDLTAAEARVLGALMEKQLTTPDAYPLTLKALTACGWTGAISGSEAGTLRELWDHSDVLTLMNSRRFS